MGSTGVRRGSGLADLIANSGMVGKAQNSAPSLPPRNAQQSSTRRPPRPDGPVRPWSAAEGSGEKERAPSGRHHPPMRAKSACGHLTSKVSSDNNGCAQGEGGTVSRSDEVGLAETVPTSRRGAAAEQDTLPPVKAVVSVTTHAWSSEEYWAAPSSPRDCDGASLPQLVHACKPIQFPEDVKSDKGRAGWLEKQLGAERLAAAKLRQETQTLRERLTAEQQRLAEVEAECCRAVEACKAAKEKMHTSVAAARNAEHEATRLAKVLEDEKATNGKLVTRQKEELRAMQTAVITAENALQASRKENADLARRVKGQADAELAAAALRPRVVQLEAGLESRCEEVAFLRAELAKAQETIRAAAGRQRQAEELAHKTMSQVSTVQEEKKSILEASGEALCTMQDERQDAVCAAEDLCRAVETLRSQLQAMEMELMGEKNLTQQAERQLSKAEATIEQMDLDHAQYLQDTVAPMEVRLRKLEDSLGRQARLAQAHVKSMTTRTTALLQERIASSQTADSSAAAGRAREKSQTASMGRGLARGAVLASNLKKDCNLAIRLELEAQVQLLADQNSRLVSELSLIEAEKIQEAESRKELAELESWRHQRRRRRGSWETIESRESSDQHDEDLAADEEEQEQQEEGDGDEDVELPHPTHEYGWDPPWTVHRAPSKESTPKRRARSDMVALKVKLAAATSELDELKLVRIAEENMNDQRERDLIQLQAELRTLRGELGRSQKECAELRRSHLALQRRLEDSNCSNVNELDAERSKTRDLSAQLKAMSAENERYRDRINQLKQDKEGNICKGALAAQSTLEAQNIRLREEVERKEARIRYLNTKLDNSESASDTPGQSERSISQATSSGPPTMALETDVKQLKARLAAAQSEHMEVSKLLKKEIREKEKKAIAITKLNQDTGELERKLRAELSEAQLGRRTAQAEAYDKTQMVEHLQQTINCAEENLAIKTLECVHLQQTNSTLSAEILALQQTVQNLESQHEGKVTNLVSQLHVHRADADYLRGRIRQRSAAQAKGNGTGSMLVQQKKQDLCVGEAFSLEIAPVV